jgi:GAF domain-containing protein
MPENTLDLATLRVLGTGLEDGRIDHEEYRRALATFLLQRFRCSRVTLWRFVGDAGRRILRCVAARSLVNGPLPAGTELVEQQYGRYFAELAKAGVYVCADTLADPNLAALRDRYDRPDGTRALLDAAFSVNGTAFGVLCCEQTGTTRSWKTGEVRDLRRIAAIVSLQIARINGHDAWILPAEAD